MQVPVLFKSQVIRIVLVQHLSWQLINLKCTDSWPFLLSQLDEMSTDTIGKPARAMSRSTTSNGTRGNPKIASRTRSLAASAVERVFSTSLGSDAGTGCVGAARQKRGGQQAQSHDWRKSNASSCNGPSPSRTLRLATFKFLDFVLMLRLAGWEQNVL